MHEHWQDAYLDKEKAVLIVKDMTSFFNAVAKDRSAQGFCKAFQEMATIVDFHTGLNLSSMTEMNYQLDTPEYLSVKTIKAMRLGAAGPAEQEQAVKVMYRVMEETFANNGLKFNPNFKP